MQELWREDIKLPIRYDDTMHMHIVSGDLVLQDSTILHDGLVIEGNLYVNGDFHCKYRTIVKGSIFITGDYIGYKLSGHGDKVEIGGNVTATLVEGETVILRGSVHSTFLYAFDLSCYDTMRVESSLHVYNDAHFASLAEAKVWTIENLKTGNIYGITGINQ